MAGALTLSFPESDIALVTFDLPGKGANILSLSALGELAAILDQLEKRKDLAGLVIKSGKPGTFIAGADIREFLASLGAPKSEVVAMCRRGGGIFWGGVLFWGGWGGGGGGGFWGGGGGVVGGGGGGGG